MNVGKINKSKGFTLIELMVTLVIVAILVSLAVPAYGKYMTKARRSDAIAMLVDVAGEQERFLSERNRYATKPTEMGYDKDELLSKEGHYSISIANNTPTSFVLTATPVSGGKQAGDEECGAFTLNSGGVKGVVDDSATEDAGYCW